MITKEAIEQILSIPDDRSGDHAQDGFDFQASTAIYLMFDEILGGRDFSVVYEKLDDFIMFNDRVNLYQSKSTSKTLTETELSRKVPVKKKKKDQKDQKDQGDQEDQESISPLNEETDQKLKEETGLSIIEKIQNNIDKIKKTTGQTDNISAHLIWNKDFKFGANLLKGTTTKNVDTKLVLASISDTAKQKILNGTGVSTFDWANIHINRLLSKQYHEEVTCNHIESTIYGLIGENDSYSRAFYESLLNKIRVARKTKEQITSDFLKTEIFRLKKNRSAPRPAEYQHLLNEDDCKNNLIHHNIRDVFTLMQIKNNPYKKAIDMIARYVDANYMKMKYPCNLYDDLKVLPDFDSLFLMYSEEKLKAIIVNVFLEKEL